MRATWWETSPQRWYRRNQTAACCCCCCLVGSSAHSSALRSAMLSRLPSSFLAYLPTIDRTLYRLSLHQARHSRRGEKEELRRRCSLYTHLKTQQHADGARVKISGTRAQAGTFFERKNLTQGTHRQIDVELDAFC